MLVAQLILFTLCGWTDEPNTAALVARLASADQAVRAEAAGALEELGRSALPALYRIRDTDDAGLRLQVERLIGLIEGQRLLRATRVRLDFEKMPLPAVIESLRAQTGFPIDLGPGETLRTRQVTLHASKPVPFWEALDRLGAAGGVRYAPKFSYPPEPLEPIILLVPAEGPTVPTSDSGPFRVHLVRLSRQREVTPVRPPGHPRARETLSTELQVFAEPGLVVTPTGPAVLEEAVDDRGRDLRVKFPAGPAALRSRPRFEEASASLFFVPLTLDPEARSGGRLRRLRGRVPITVMTRTGDPMVVPLAGSEGRTFSRGGVTLSVTGVRLDGVNRSIKLTLDREPGKGRTTSLPASPLGEYRPAFAIEDHVQVQDDQGRPLWCYPEPLKNAEGGKLETLITVYPAQGKAPARILYHDVIGTTTELTFEFKDVPLP
jgi:hypothetical protein